MNTDRLRRSMTALGERLSRVPRRIAAVLALVAVLAAGGLGAVLGAHVHPSGAAVATVTPGQARAWKDWGARQDEQRGHHRLHGHRAEGADRD